MTILVTGSGTLIGNTLIRYLIKKKQSLIGTYNKTFPKNLKNKIKIIKLNLHNNFKINLKFNYLVHCASAIPDDNLSKKFFFDTNVKGFRRLLKISKQNKVKKIVLLSTVSVYGKIKTNRINEKTKINQQDIYGKTKYIMENDLKIYSRKYNIDYVILRLPGVIGKNSKHNFLSRLIEKLKYNNVGTFTLYNKNLKFNNLVHVEDLSKIIFQCINSNRLSGIFLLGSKNPVKFKNLISKIKKYCKLNFIFKSNSNSFNLDLSKSLKNKIKLNSATKTFEKFLSENLNK